MRGSFVFVFLSHPQKKLEHKALTVEWRSPLSANGAPLGAKVYDSFECISGFI